MPALPLNEAQLADAERLRRAWNDYKKRTPGTSQEKVAAECGWKTQASFNQYLLGKIPLNLAALLKMCKAMGGINPSDISPALAAQLPPTLQTPAAGDEVMPATIDPAGPAEGYIRLEHLSAQPSMGHGAVVDELEAVVQHLDVLERWVREEVGSVDAQRIKVLTAKGRSMWPAINHRDLVFVDVTQRAIDAPGIYVVDVAGRLLLKKALILSNGTLVLRSENQTEVPDEERYDLAREGNTITICGKVLAWWSLRKG